MAISSMIITRNSLTLILLGLQFGGDRVQRSEGLHYALKACVDSGVHGLVAGISWLIVVLDHRSRYYVYDDGIYEIVACMCLGSIIDVDHFIAACSFKLKEALRLEKRPPFHSSSLLLVVVVSMALLSTVMSSRIMWRASFVVLVAGLSHHLRDGSRRGLWFPPYGSTAPIWYPLYLLSTITLPHIVRLLLISPEINAETSNPFSV